MKKTHVLFLLLIVWSNWAFAQEEGRFRFGLQRSTGVSYFQRTFHQDGAKELDQELNTFLPFRRIRYQSVYLLSLQYKPKKYNFLLGIRYCLPQNHFYPYPVSYVGNLGQRYRFFELSFTQRLEIKDNLSHNFRFGVGSRLYYGTFLYFFLPGFFPNPDITVFLYHPKNITPQVDCSYGIERVGNRGNRWLWEVSVSLELLPQFTASVLDANGALMGYRSIDYRRHMIGFGLTRYFDGKKPSIYKTLSQ